LEVWGALGPQLVELESDRTTLGRAPTNTVTIEVDTSVSRLHAVIERYPTGYCIRDLGSANGTFLNGERVTAERQLHSGDEVRLGNSRLTFYLLGHSQMDTTAIADGPPDLTKREREVLVALCRPLLAGAAFNQPATTDELARELFVSVPAVKFHLGNLYDKFGIEDDESGARRVRLANDAIRRRAVTIADLRGQK
jgi:DNA-binding CsgD family transcriptional regulator